MRSILIVLFLASALLSCNQSHTWEEFEKYPKALNFEIRELGNGTANQASFYVEEAYPFDGVIEHYRSQVGPKWKPCPSDDNWQSYVDSTTGKQILVHELKKYWANHEVSRLLILAVSYRSVEFNNMEEPNTKRQDVFLIEYRERGLGSALKRLKLDC